VSKNPNKNRTKIGESENFFRPFGSCIDDGYNIGRLTLNLFGWHERIVKWRFLSESSELGKVLFDAGEYLAYNRGLMVSLYLSAVLAKD